MKRILFVDDEPKILMGLRRSLRCYRGEWEMCFAEGGGAALEQCAQGPFDVVVSDARMPGMDGSASPERGAQPLSGYRADRPFRSVQRRFGAEMRGGGTPVFE